jgi:hypothetical protein
MKHTMRNWVAGALSLMMAASVLAAALYLSFPWQWLAYDGARQQQKHPGGSPP